MPRTNALTALRSFVAQGSFFHAGAPIQFASAYGALDVLGSLNADFGGTLAQSTLPPQAAVALQEAEGASLRIHNPQMVPLGETDICVDLRSATPEDLPPSAAWAEGIVALFLNLQRARGASVVLNSNIPMAAGQAGSTAVLAALASVLLTTDGPPAPLAVAQAVAEAFGRCSRTYSSGHGHIMNALTAIYPRGERPALLRYSAQPYRLVGAVPLPGDARILALDTGVRYAGRSMGTSLEELRIAAAMGYRIIETIYRDLGRDHTPLQGYLANTSPLLYRQYFRSLLPRRLRGSDFLRTYGGFTDAATPLTSSIDAGAVYRVRTAVDHLIAEHEHAEQFLQAMEELADAEAANAGGDQRAKPEQELTLARAGRLLLASHHSYRLRLELSCREADWLVDHLMEAGPEQGVYGARITRAGGGGTVVALMNRSSGATDALLETIQAYHLATGLTLGITEA